MTYAWTYAWVATGSFFLGGLVQHYFRRKAWTAAVQQISRNWITEWIEKKGCPCCGSKLLSIGMPRDLPPVGIECLSCGERSTMPVHYPKR
jgi:hypothetical protein